MINVGQGKLTGGAFYMPHRWKLSQDGSGAGGSSDGSLLSSQA
jgi:hypothetical protein